MMLQNLIRCYSLINLTILHLFIIFKSYVAVAVTETVGCGFVCLFFDKYNKLTYVIGEQVTDTNKLPRKCNKTQTVADPEGGTTAPFASKIFVFYFLMYQF